jgi:hypothetical protein
VVASHVPYAMEARRLWKMKVELAGVKVREMELVCTIAELEQEAAAAEIISGSDGPESEVVTGTGGKDQRPEHCHVDVI